MLFISRKFILIFAILGVVIAIGVYLSANNYYNNRSVLTGDKIIIINQGSNLNSISRQLVEDNIIDYPEIFVKLSQFFHKKPIVKAGEYKIVAGATPNDIITMLMEGKYHMRSVTFPEGFTNTQIIERLNNIEYLFGEISTTYQEGVLLPDTYNYTYGQQREDILKVMHQRMQSVLEDAWNNRQDDLPLDNINEALILASIVEKEAAIIDEKQVVASVFINRLRKNMRLQTDPTVIYAITKGRHKLDRLLTKADLRIDSPFNTYMVKGLPPTPIANPGKHAILAVLNPIDTNYFYFVATGNGGHYFSENLAQHNRYVAKYRKLQKSRNN